MSKSNPEIQSPAGDRPDAAGSVHIRGFDDMPPETQGALVELVKAAQTMLATKSVSCVLSRDECIWQYCPNPGGCKDECAHPHSQNTNEQPPAEGSGAATGSPPSMHTDHIRPDGTIDDQTIETYYAPCTGGSLEQGYIRIFADNGGTDIETRVSFASLIALGLELRAWTRGVSVFDQQ